MSHGIGARRLSAAAARARPDPRRDGECGILLLAATLLLALPALYWGYQSWHSAGAARRPARPRRPRRRDAGRRGRLHLAAQPAERHRAADRLLVRLTYRLRPEEGGALRKAQVHLEGGAPIFTPPAIYDPQDPGRVMLEPEMERDMSWSELLGPFFLLLLPGRDPARLLRDRRGAASPKRRADPDPLIVPVEKVIRQPGKLYLHTRAPGAPRPVVDTFPVPLDAAPGAAARRRAGGPAMGARAQGAERPPLCPRRRSSPGSTSPTTSAAGCSTPPAAIEVGRAAPKSGAHGEVAEWFKAAVLKTAVGSRPPWVRIPPSPPGPQHIG